jgi:flagellar biosynthesis/type III secretory pathway protein FliH
MPVVQLNRAIGVVTLVSGAAATAARQRAAEQTASLQETQAQQQLYRDACTALEQAADRLNQLYNEMVAGHNEAIARLSVEIARKVLMRNITDGDYRIEAIIKEALQSVPESAGATVRLNPQDLSDVQALQTAGDPSLAGVKLIADPAIGRAECVVESPKGMIKLLIDEHLDQISKALGKTG